MSLRTRFASDLALAPRVERAGTCAACFAICVALACCALGVGTAVADTAGGATTGGLLLSAYDPALPPSRPSPSVRPGPRESTVVIVTDEDGSEPRANNNLRQPVNLNPGSERWIGPPEVESNPLGSTSMFSGLPPMQGNDLSKSPPPTTAKTPPAEPKTPPAEASGSVKQAANHKQNESDQSSGRSIFSQLFGFQTESKSPSKDPFGPPDAGLGVHRPITSSTASSEPKRLPAVFTPDESVSGLWKQVSVRGEKPADGSAPPNALNNRPRPGVAAVPAPPRKPSGAETTEAVSARMSGLIHQFVASNDEPQYAPRTRLAQARQSAGAAEGATRSRQEESGWAALWKPMAVTEQGQPHSKNLLAQAEKGPGGTAAESQPPALLMPFYWTDGVKKPTSQVASSGGTRSGSTLIPSQSTLGGGARPVAFLEDADGESLPQPTKKSDDRLQPEDLGIPGEPPKTPTPTDAAAKTADGKEPENLVTAKKVGEEPPDNSLQFLRFATVLLKPGQTQYDVGLTYTFSENQFAFLGTNTMGDPVVDDADFRLRSLEIPFQMRCGLTKRVQMFVGSSVGWSNAEISVFNLEDFQNDGGLGDVFGGLTIQFRDATECSPYLIGTGGFTAPTGGDPFSTAEGLLPSGPTLGNGFWTIFGNLLWIRSYDPVTVFYGFGAEHSFQHDYIGLEFQPGNEYNYTFGVGFAVNERLTLSTRFRGAWIDDLEVEGRRIPGSTLEPMSIRMAATLAQAKNRIVEPFVEFGITDDATTANFGMIWTY